MVQVRKLVLAIAAASALSSGMAQALGLGELTLKSTPNQPLVAEIELLDVQQLTAAEVVPSLATPADFANAGVPRQPFLNDLTFTPVINANGKSVLRVTSSQPLSEPMVKFLVQVMWPNGRLLRDYSVLLDPSRFSTPGAEAVQRTPSQSVSAPVTSATKPTQYTTTPRDTLWEIAAKVRNGGSIQQTMLAIQALNPEAFINGNINLLKTGQVLRLPDPVQSTALPQPQAIAEVAAQNAAWRQGRRGAGRSGQQQLDATNRPRGDGAPAQAAGRDNLSLVSAESAKAGTQGAAGDAQALTNQLAVTQESLDSARRDNEELKSRMADLQSQLDKLQRLIELKNNQLAQMQAQGATVPPAGESTPAMSAELAPAPAAPASESAPTAQATPEAIPGRVPGATPESAPASTPEAATPVTPLEPTPAASSEPKYNDLLTNPILLGLVGGGALLLLLLLLLLARRRKAQQEAEKHLRMARALEEEADFSPELDLPPSSFEGIEVPPPSVKLENRPVPQPAPRPAPLVAPVIVTPPIAAPLVAPAADRADDVLALAQSHIDRGRLNQAAEFLEQGIKAEPQRADLRLKLMEVYGQQGDRDAFVAQERQLVANGENHAQVELLKSRFPAMAVATTAGIAAAAVAAELDAQYVKDLLADTSATDDDKLDDTFDLSLDDLDTPPATPAPEPVAELDAFPSDDDLSFESLLKQQTQGNESLDDLSEFDLDLGADGPAPALSDEDFLLDLDDDLKDLPASDTPALDTPSDDLELPEDFDLSLADEMDASDAPKDAFESELEDVNSELDRLSDDLAQPTFTAEDALASADDESDFDFLSGTDEVATKLDLAQAYIDMGDNDGARDILGEVLSEGDATQKSEAQEMLSRLV